MYNIDIDKRQCERRITITTLDINNEVSFEALVLNLKALTDKNRLRIIDMLSCGEMCACDLLEGLDISQPTLSHHMKKLVQCNLVNVRNEGSWSYYSLNLDELNKNVDFLREIFREKENCICEMK